MKLPAHDTLRRWSSSLSLFESPPLNPPGGHAEAWTSAPGQRAFTMVEIAICLAVIGFALVAIIGVLPTGMQVQRDNREDSIINQDATYFMEAIRSGAQGLDELTNYVEHVNGISNLVTGRDIIGQLSIPGTNVAIVRAISGSAVEKPPASTDITFRYQLKVENAEFNTASVNLDPLVRSNLVNSIRELRLEFRWPVLPKGGLGNNRQVLRTLASGRYVSDPTNSYFFFHP